MATQVLTVVTPIGAIIGAIGGVSETNDRIAQIEVRPGMREGERHALSVRRWGHGHWCVANGQSHYFTDRSDAEASADRWIEEGR